MRRILFGRFNFKSNEILLKTFMGDLKTDLQEATSLGARHAVREPLALGPLHAVGQHLVPAP